MLVVDDSPLIRRVVRDAIAASTELEVAGEAADGLEAIQRIHELHPDLVTLDIEMPAMGGLDTLGYIMSECPRPVVVLSGHEAAQGGDLTMRALELGAVDFVRKPVWADALDVETLRRRLLQALGAAARGRVQRLVPAIVPQRPWRPATAPSRPAPREPPGAARRVIGIAASTGGPRTLAELLPRIPDSIDAAIVVVQHMPAGFTTSLARRLRELGPRAVQEVRHGLGLHARNVYVAPGGLHTRVVPGVETPWRFEVDESPPVHGVRPAADVTFASLAAVAGAQATVVVLTGMGRDGAVGARAVRAAGGRVLVQDPDTCVVGGMGLAVLALGGADAVSDPAGIPAALERLCGQSRPA